MILRNVDSCLLLTRNNIPQDLNSHFNFVVLPTFISFKFHFLDLMRPKRLKLIYFEFLNSKKNVNIVINTDVLYDYSDGIKLTYWRSIVLTLSVPN
jgi:hypothetical protein